MKPVLIVQNWEAESAGHLADYLDDNNVRYNVVRTFDGEALPKVGDIKAAVILGNPISVRDYQKHDYLKRLFAFLADSVRTDIPLLGICFGGQLLAKVLGADVVRNEVREIGLYRATLTNEGRQDKLFAGVGPELEVFHWHADTFMIPHGATLLATGKTCRNQAFRKGNPEPRADEIPTWCDVYAEELAEEGLTKNRLVSDYAAGADRMKQLSYRLMQNFLG